VGLLDRLKSAATPDDGLDALQRAIDQEGGRLWLPLYTDASRIGDVFAQRAPNVVEVVTGGEFTLDVGGGYLAVASVKAGRKITSSQRIAITPLLQTLLLKEAATDLLTRPAEPTDTLLHYVGPGRILLPGETLLEEPASRITPQLATSIQALRERQERTLRFNDPELPGTFLWLGQGPFGVGSIASIRGTSQSFSSFGPLGTFGVLGVFENQLAAVDAPGESVTLLSPLMIWHHAGV
jgi:hypothetical protein